MIELKLFSATKVFCNVFTWANNSSSISDVCFIYISTTVMKRNTLKTFDDKTYIDVWRSKCRCEGGTFEFKKMFGGYSSSWNHFWWFNNMCSKLKEKLKRFIFHTAFQMEGVVWTALTSLLRMYVDKITNEICAFSLFVFLWLYTKPPTDRRRRFFDYVNIGGFFYWLKSIFYAIFQLFLYVMLRSKSLTTIRIFSFCEFFVRISVRIFSWLFYFEISIQWSLLVKRYSVHVSMLLEKNNGKPHFVAL